jgi:predicted nucleic acid-binding protein
MKDDIFLIDTDILVYAYDSSEIEKQEICSSLLKKCWKQEMSYAIALQNLSEFYVVVTKKIERPLSNETARKIIKDIIDFNNWQVLGINDISLITAIDLCTKYKIHYWDGLLCAAMKQNEINKIYTENIKDFKKIPWIKAVDPMQQ